MKGQHWLAHLLEFDAVGQLHFSGITFEALPLLLLHQRITGHGVETVKTLLILFIVQFFLVLLSGFGLFVCSSILLAQTGFGSDSDRGAACGTLG